MEKLNFELRKNLSFISESLKMIAFSGNFTYTYSQIDMTDAEYNARLTNEKDGQTIQRTRQMAGQAPYIVNAGFSYDNIERGLSAGLFYNVKGRTLEIVGGNVAPASVRYHERRDVRTTNNCTARYRNRNW